MPWRRLMWMAIWSATMAAVAPGAGIAQSVDLVKTYQNLEAAKTSGKTDEALKYGNDAVALAEASGDRQNLVALLKSVAEYAATAGHAEVAASYYERAIAIQEKDLGVDHPDLVPTLTALAQLRADAARYADAAVLEERILAIERAAYGERHENVLATLGRLRHLYQTANDAPALARIDTQLQAAATTRGSLPAPGGLAGKNHRYKQTQGFATVRVFYGTNRAPSGDLKPAAFYGKARGELQYGYLDVTIPATHQEAQLETQPRWADYILDVSANRSRYVLLDKVTPLPKDDFVRALQHDIKAAPSKDVFIFVHGFNNTFEDAARRAAQLVYDVDFDGTPLLYSWPSQGSTTAYAVDEAAVGISGRKMADFLDTVVSQSGAEHVHILAHSMGNRALIEALQTYLAKRAPDKRQHVFGQLVFTAPDVDRDYFIDALDSLKHAADRVTLYASNNDYALRSSQMLHGAPRAGTAGDVIIRIAGLDSIDMSAVPADVLGHAYFAANAGAIFDIFRLLWRGDAPPDRCGMSDRKAAGALAVWVFDANVCKGGDLLEAGVMFKRFGNLARQQLVANMATLTDPSQKQQLSLILKQLDALRLTVRPDAGAARQ